MSVQGTTAAPRSCDIPTRRIIINNSDQLPGDYSTTPGGTFFSTTPGGTRIVYERSFLIACKNSPLTKSPPLMAKIPGVTEPGEVELPKRTTHKESEETTKAEHPDPDQPQFEMDI